MICMGIIFLRVLIRIWSKNRFWEQNSRFSSLENSMVFWALFKEAMFREHIKGFWLIFPKFLQFRRALLVRVFRVEWPEGTQDEALDEIYRLSASFRVQGWRYVRSMYRQIGNFENFHFWRLTKFEKSQKISWRKIEKFTSLRQLFGWMDMV